MERNQGEVRCIYCGYKFMPEPIVRKAGKKRIAYIECPRCGNGIERAARWYEGKRRRAG